jgi:1,4-alpha-glucan branching enzyme
MRRRSSKSEREVQFELSVEPGSRVYVAGTFNDWSPTASPLEDNPGSGHCRATLRLPAGRYEYKFVVNDEWLVDPNCPEWASNDQGSLNSVLHV